ncbi:MAG: hypothetical protein H3C30_09810 [Candidatus Hydrogenedentes bacterium]|nr:hypothetical protein [Candidatus Hydrogenedentota bacterium]
MDSNKFLIVVAVVLVGFLGLPIVMQAVRGEQAAGASGAGAVAPPPPAAAKEPPRLNESNLIGTEWQVQAGDYKIKVTVAPGGLLYATHPMVKAVTGQDYIEGRWTLNYDKLQVSASLGGKEMNETLYIVGDRLESSSGKPVERFK